MKQGLMGFACLTALALGASAQAQQTDTHFYDVHGRLIATTKAPLNGGYRTRYGLDVADNRSGRIIEAANARTTDDQLLSGQELLPGQYLISADARFVFLFQAGDSNAVIYGPSGALWSTETWNGLGTTLRLQTDGNLVLLGPSNNPVWNSGSPGHPSARLIMQSDGNLVIYDGATAVWNTGTGGH